MKLDGNLILAEIINLNDPNLLKLQDTLIYSFPSLERRDFVLFCRLLIEEPIFKAYAILENDEYVGFITSWEFSEFIYVENFAIDEKKRGGGIGSRTMKFVLATLNVPIVLEVEEVVDDLTARRVSFYETLGFRLHHFKYEQPPYREGDSWTPMKLMTHGDFDMENKFEWVKEQLYRKVYNIKRPE